ncbi:hypothetical protein SpCBS45565_g03958 [Spizellomyces sp. 'palustris']|nr:hypothetical protein SpCBS45565_g03958 [Spizellomyces sp. 'palustris']
MGTQSAMHQLKASGKSPSSTDGPVTAGVSWRDYAPFFFFALLVKLFLIPSYRSTDFEVHRNWLAITHNLPIAKWYYEDTSEWTLDYPPFFAWFEWILSHPARLFDSKMLEIDNLNYASSGTVLFQRLSVMASEVVFFTGALRVVRHVRDRRHRLTFLGLIFWSPGLLFVDHIHFQYNGFLYGIQLFSISAMLQNQPIIGAILFAAILNFKHIYLYQAPAYFIYLLRSYCFRADRFSFRNFLLVGAATIGVFIASFGPFIAHILQIISRLFPFKRGLCHAYWAPNFWALYAFGDRVLIHVARIIGLSAGVETASLTRGLVGDTVFGFLPDVKPVHTLLLTVLSQVPILMKLWSDPTPARFVDSLILCGFGSFLFGWHVHEKAILLVLIPLSLLVRKTPEYARIFYVLSCTGYYSLFPLLFRPAETVIKANTLLAFAMLGHHFLAMLHRVQ